MKPVLKTVFKVLLLSILGIVLSNVGCQSNAPNSPSSDVVIKHSADQLQFLKPQQMRFHKVFKDQNNISASQGGTILIGDEESRYSSINFLPGDLDEDTDITFEWNTVDYVAEFLPEGISFNNPVRVVLSYRDANLNEIVENNLRIWYFNDPENIWELIGGDVNTAEKTVEGYITHFSRYALAEED